MSDNSKNVACWFKHYFWLVFLQSCCSLTKKREILTSFVSFRPHVVFGLSAIKFEFWSKCWSFCSRRMRLIKCWRGIKGCGTVMNSNPRPASGAPWTMVEDKSDKSQPTVSGLSIPLWYNSMWFPGGTSNISQWTDRYDTRHLLFHCDIATPWFKNDSNSVLKAKVKLEIVAQSDTAWTFSHLIQISTLLNTHSYIWWWWWWWWSWS